MEVRMCGKKCGCVERSAEGGYLRYMSLHFARCVQTPVSFGESGPSVALRNALRTAWKMAEQEGSPIGVHHLYLALIDIPAFQKIIVRSGCDLKTIKQYAAHALAVVSTRARGSCSGPVHQLFNTNMTLNHTLWFRRLQRFDQFSL